MCDVVRVCVCVRMSVSERGKVLLLSALMAHSSARRVDSDATGTMSSSMTLCTKNVPFCGMILFPECEFGVVGGVWWR